MATITRGKFKFDVTESGPAGGELVLLLHGFPQQADSWVKVVPLLNEAGYRTLAMSQRGYSPGARPSGRTAYKVPELVADAAAVVDAYGGGPVHVVGHDWGAVVAWGIATQHPEKVASLTALSVTHGRAFLRSMVTSRQLLHSWYMLFFQLPWLPERLMHWQWERFLRFGGQSDAASARDRASFPEPGDLTGPISWYRALPLVNLWKEARPVSTPTLFVWSDRDIYLLRSGAEKCGDYVEGPYQFETLAGVSHWIPEEAPRELAGFLLPHLRKWPARELTLAGREADGRGAVAGPA